MVPAHVVLITAVITGLVWTSEACSGNYTAVGGVIQSPNFPANYTNNLDCVYTITAPSTHRVTLTFLDFDLQASSDGRCIYDYFEIRDGDSQASPRLGGYCGTGLSKPRRTFGHQMWIRFFTDGSVTGSGFRVSYSSAVHQHDFLLIAGGSPGRGIYRMDIETGSSYRIPVMGTLVTPIALDYDPVDSTIYWTDAGILNEMRACNLDGSNVRRVLDAGPAATLDGLAVDSLSRLLFYSDAGNDVIAMMSMSTFEHRTIINNSLDKPRAIVLDTTDGVLFWTDLGSSSKIERANYDGSDRQTLVSSGLMYPNALALDMVYKYLYWVDAGTDRVERTGTQGNGRTVLSWSWPDSLFPRHMFGLTLFQGSLFATDWGANASASTSSLIFRLPVGGGKALVFGTADTIRLNDIHTYSPLLHQTGANGCGSNNGGCSVFCLPLPSNSNKCMCPDGQSLSSDQRNCGDSSETTTTTTNPPSAQGSLPIIAGSAGGGVVFIAVVIIAVVCVVRRRRGDTIQRPARKKDNQGQVENPYETLRDPPRRPFVTNKAFDPEVCNNGGQSSVYDEARDSARNSEEIAVTEPVPNYLPPVSAPNHPARPAPCRLPRPTAPEGTGYMRTIPHSGFPDTSQNPQHSTYLHVC